MKLYKAIISSLILSVALTTNAGTPIFNIVPIIAPPSFIVAGQTATITYKVSVNTNNLLGINEFLPQFTTPAKAISA